MSLKQSKTITYFRVKISPPASHSFEYYVKLAHKALPKACYRTFKSGVQEFIGCHAGPAKPAGEFLHVALVTPGEPASTVPSNKTTDEIDIELMAPPQNGNYMDGDMFMLIKDNHLLFCSSGLNIAKATEYLKLLFDESNISVILDFQLLKVANIDKLKLLKRGIKAIRLDAGIYPASLEYLHESESGPKTITQKVIGPVVKNILALLRDDPRLSEITDKENLTAEVILKYNRRGGTELGQVGIQSISEKLINEGDEGVKFVTYNDETLSGNEIILKKAVNLPKFGKSVDYREVWRALAEFYDGLKSSGLLEQ